MTERHLSLRLVFFLLGLVLLQACNDANQTDQPPGRAELDAGFLLGSAPLQQPVTTAAFTPLPAGPTANRFEGRLTLSLPAADGQMEVLSDLFGRATGAGDLPELTMEMVQVGNELIPADRGRQTDGHAEWEWVLGAGQVWDENGDAGWTRASLPFALVQRNANCTHNGLLTFLFKSDGAISRIAYQVGSETCFYFQANFWGIGEASYEPMVVTDRDETIAEYRREQAARLPVRPIETLADSYPGADTAQFSLHEPGEVTTYGFVIDGVHYTGGCMTRFGPYPFCQDIVLPSYSLAKTLLAATTYMRLEYLFPGAGQAQVVDYVPECRGDERWAGVTLQHLLDMGTGNYRSTVNQEDEFFSYEGPMFSEETHAEKIADACSLFPRSSDPGATWVYHTSDTYIAGTLMNAYLRQRLGPDRDIFEDLLIQDVLGPLSFSQVMRSGMRTYDDVAQPFSGYGLFLYPDDIARFSLFLLTSEGMVAGKQVLDREQLFSALQKNPDDPGLEAGAENLRYNNGIWAASLLPPETCSQAAWLPFMSGYGGISVVLMPNESVYYVFSDGAHFKWAEAAAESNKLKAFCGENHGSVQ